MRFIISKYRNGFRFFCPVSRKFFGPYFKSKELIKNFFSWYDDDVKFIGTWMNNKKCWAELILEWIHSENKNISSKDVCIMNDYIKNDYIKDEYIIHEECIQEV